MKEVSALPAWGLQKSECPPSCDSSDRPPAAFPGPALGTRLLPTPKPLPQRCSSPRFPKPRPLENHYPILKPPRTENRPSRHPRPSPVRNPAITWSGPAPDLMPLSDRPLGVLPPLTFSPLSLRSPCPVVGLHWGAPTRAIRSSPTWVGRYSRRPATRSCGTSTWAAVLTCPSAWAPGCGERACQVGALEQASQVRGILLACACKRGTGTAQVPSCGFGAGPVMAEGKRRASPRGSGE